MGVAIAFNGRGNSILWAWQCNLVFSEVQISDFLLHLGTITFQTVCTCTHVHTFLCKLTMELHNWMHVRMSLFCSGLLGTPSANPGSLEVCLELTYACSHGFRDYS